MKFHHHNCIQNGGNCERIGCEINPFGAKIGTRSTKQNGRGGSKAGREDKCVFGKILFRFFQGRLFLE